MYAVVHYEEPIGTHILSPTDTVHLFSSWREACDFISADHAYRTWAIDNWMEVFTGDELYGGISRSYKKNAPKGVLDHNEHTTDFIDEWFEAAVGTVCAAVLLFAGSLWAAI